MMGDSRTSPTTWPATLTGELSTATNSPWEYVNLGFSGATVASWLGALQARLAVPQPLRVYNVLINLGFNDGIDFNDPTATAAWIANYKSLISAVSAYLPNAKVYLMRPSNSTGGTHYDQMATAINTIVTDMAPVVALGPDERVWLTQPGMTYDGVHYSVAGNAECVAQWKTVLGY